MSPAATSSLVTTPTGSLPLCAACGSSSVTAITMTLTDGSPVDFLSCRSCERRSWSQGGSDLQIEVVLDKARKPTA